MTAFFGLIGRAGRTVGLTDLAGMSATLAPFGSERLWVGEAGSLVVGIGSRGGGAELSLPSSGGDLTLVADSHLTHRNELAAKVRLPPSSSDAQLIAAAFDRWGDDLVDHLDGEFVVVIVDQRRNRVMLLRDHAAKRPLALYESESLVAFGSSALALTGAPDVGHALDEQRAVEVLLDANASGRSFVVGVRTVLPGTQLWIDNSSVRERRWWAGRFEVNDLGSVEAHALQLRSVFDDSVAASLAGARAPGVLLSGGLDSASVAAVGAQMRVPDPLRTYTLVPPADWTGPAQRGWVQSERREIELLKARYTNLEPSFVKPRKQSLFKDEAWWELGVPPFRNPMTSKALFDCFRDASADGVDTILWGAAGNMAFSAGGDKWLSELARRGRLIELYREFDAWAKVNRLERRYVLREHLLSRLFPRVAERIDRRKGSTHVHDMLLVSAVSQDRLAELDLESVTRFSTVAPRHDWTRDLGGVFAKDTTTAEMSAAMRVHYRLELLDPTADRRLLEVAGVQPDWRRNRRGVWRAIAREAMRDALPPEIVDRVELGEQLPEYLDILTAKREELQNEIEEMRDHPASRNTLDVERLEALMVTWPELTDRNRKAVMYAYREALPKTLGMSRYLRWFEDRAKRVAAGGPSVVMHDPFADFV